MRKLFASLLFFVSVSTAYAGDYTDRYLGGMSKSDFIRAAMTNAQQSGDFYYIPFPNNGGYGKSGENRADMVQVILDTLVQFEKNKGVSITFYTVDENHQLSAGDDIGKVQGIFVKAMPISKPTTKK